MKKLSLFERTRAAMLADLDKVAKVVKKAKTFNVIDKYAQDGVFSTKSLNLLDELFDEEEAQ